IPAPRTLIRSIRKCRPAHFMNVTADGAISDERYWNLVAKRPKTELSPEELGMIEMQEGESLEDIKARLKPKKSTISIDMLNTANSYDDKVALIRFLVSEDSGRVATVMRNLVKG
ncbi:MAG: hypothetical protein ACO2Y4_06395, partial [Burkholderiaceae bacterium]